MKKLWLLPVIVLFISGCSDGEEDEKVSLSLEEKIQEQMKQNDFEYDFIIDYDIKGDYIYAVSRGKGGLEWITGYKAVPPPVMSLSDENAPIVTIIQPRESDIKEVKVFGEPIKSITYYDDVMDNYSEEITYWITYSKERRKSGCRIY